MKAIRPVAVVRILPFLFSALLFVPSAFSQGPLAPPGAPQPSMKSLSQIEPRTAITNTGAVTLSVAGSYYLTTNITVSSGDAITIDANNVTLDLNGFTIFSTAPSASGTAILLNNGRANIAIHNGHIRSGVTNNSSGVFSGSGFNNGIYGSSSLPLIYNVRVADVSVEGCLSDGIFLGSLNGTVVESCTVHIAGNYGIGADTIVNSTAIDCGSDAIAARQATSCRGSSYNGSGVSAGTAQNCYGTTTAGVGGITVSAAADNCRGDNSGSGGWGLLANTAQNCYGSGKGSSVGVLAAFSANNCYGVSSNSYGVRIANIFTGVGGTATGCRGASYSLAGLSAGTVLNGVGTSVSGTGVEADTAENSKGASHSGIGVLVTSSANNCSGSSSNNFGLRASTGGSSGATATGCQGTSTSGTGLSATTALNCTGTSTSGDGLTATSAQNCHGISSGSSGTGLWAFSVAIGCYGQNFSTGTGLNAYIANSSRGVSPGTPESISFKYNMP